MPNTPRAVFPKDQRKPRRRDAPWEGKLPSQKAESVQGHFLFSGPRGKTPVAFAYGRFVLAQEREPPGLPAV